MSLQIYYNFSLNYNAKWKLQRFRGAKVYTKQKMVQKGDKMTNLSEYNFYKKTSV